MDNHIITDQTRSKKCWKKNLKLIWDCRRLIHGVHGVAATVCWVYTWWQLGPGPTHSTTKWEKWPAFSTSFKNSFTSCQISLWHGTCHRSSRTGLRPSLPSMPAKLLSGWPGSPLHYTTDSLVSRFFGFVAPFSLALPFHCYLWCSPAKEKVIIRVPETTLLLFYTITVLYVLIKASAGRIKLTKCWALNKLSTGGVAFEVRWNGDGRKEQQVDVDYINIRKGF